MLHIFARERDDYNFEDTMTVVVMKDLPAYPNMQSGMAVYDIRNVLYSNWSRQSIMAFVDNLGVLVLLPKRNICIPKLTVSSMFIRNMRQMII